MKRLQSSSNAAVTFCISWLSQCPQALPFFAVALKNKTSLPISDSVCIWLFFACVHMFSFFFFLFFHFIVSLKSVFVLSHNFSSFRKKCSSVTWEREKKTGKERRTCSLRWGEHYMCWATNGPSTLCPLLKGGGLFEFWLTINFLP